MLAVDVDYFSHNPDFFFYLVIDSNGEAVSKKMASDVCTKQRYEIEFFQAEKKMKVLTFVHPCLTVMENKK